MQQHILRILDETGLVVAHGSSRDAHAFPYMLVEITPESICICFTVMPLPSVALIPAVESDA